MRLKFTSKSSFSNNILLLSLLLALLLLLLFEKRFDIHYDEALMAIFVKFVIRVKENYLPIQEALEILQLSKDLQNDHNLLNKNFERNISYLFV